ncbi:adenosine receptor A2a-like [Oculina patagonica]
MNASQRSHGTLPLDCGVFTILGGPLPPSATEAKAVLIFLAVILVVTSPFTAALNALVIIAVKTKSRLRANKSNILLACLATTDLMVGVIVQPMYAAFMITFALGDTSNGSCVLQNLTQIFRSVPCDTSLIHLALISGERYLAMKHTFAYNTGLVTEARLLISSALAWLFSLILQMPLFFKQAAFFVINNLFIVLSIAMITFCQITVYREVRRHEKELSTQQVTEEARQKFLKDKKAFKLTTTIVVVLFLCYIPLFVFRVVVIFYLNNMSVIVLLCLISAGVVAILNSLLNPFIYSVRMRQFRVAFIELTCRTVNVAEAEEIEMRVFRFRPNAVGSLEAKQEHERDHQNAKQANVNNTNNNNNEILPQHENHIEELN